MNELVKVKDFGVVIDSREVAEMCGKEHSKLLRDISVYIGYMSDNPDLDSQQF